MKERPLLWTATVTAVKYTKFVRKLPPWKTLGTVEKCHGLKCGQSTDRLRNLSRQSHWRNWNIKVCVEVNYYVLIIISVMIIISVNQQLLLQCVFTSIHCSLTDWKTTRPIIQWRRQNFFSGGLGPFPPPFPFSSLSSLPPFPPLPFPSIPFLPSLSPPSQARSQDCQNEEADRSSIPPLPSPALPCAPLRSRPA